MGLLRLLGIEKYLKKVKDYVDEKDGEISDKVDNVKHPTPDWNAKSGSTGYIANRTHYVSDNGNTWSSVTLGSEFVGGLVKDKATINNVEKYKFFIIKGTKYGNVGPISTLSSATYHVEFNVTDPLPSSTSLEVRVLPTSNTIEVVGGNPELFLTSNFIPLEVKTLDKGYLPAELATEEHIQHALETFSSNEISPLISNIQDRVSALEGPTNLLSILSNDLPIINIDVDWWANNAMSFAQVGITDEHVNKWILLSSLKVAEIDSYGIEPQNTGDYFNTQNDVSGGVLSFRFDVDEGNVGIDFDLLSKEVYVHNDWE